MTRDAFEAQALPHRAHLLALGRRLARDADQAQDLVQDTYLRAWDAWESFDGENCRAWLSRILTNLFVSRCRRAERERRFEVSDGDGPLQHLHAGAHERCSAQHHGGGAGDEVVAAVADLPPDMREALLLVDVGGESYRDAARALGAPIGTVCTRVMRGRSRLRRALGEYAAGVGIGSRRAEKVP